MASFDNKVFLAKLSASLPNANVRDGALAPEQKRVKLETLRIINQRYSHGPVLGGGALYGTIKLKAK